MVTGTDESNEWTLFIAEKRITQKLITNSTALHLNFTDS